MRIVFFGSSHFALPSLIALKNSGYEIVCVVTQPDKKSGRGMHLSSTMVKDKALTLGLALYQPASINSQVAEDFLKSKAADLFVIIAYGQILNQQIIDIPKEFSLNIHASLLPKYRGAGPISRVLINGEKVTGVSVMKVVLKMDAGPLLLKEELKIEPDDDALSLEDKLSRLSSEALLKSVELIKQKKVSLTNQDDLLVSLAPKLKKEDGRINWKKSAEEIHNLVRGCVNWPGAFSYLDGKMLKIFKSEILPASTNPQQALPGEISSFSKRGIAVSTGSGEILIRELQIEGKRRMSAQEFFAGHKISSKKLCSS